MTVSMSGRMTPDAKALLARTVRGLRERLLRDLKDEAERRYRLSVPVAKAGLDEASRLRRERLEGWIEERLRGASLKSAKERDAARERLLGEAVKEAAATLLNRVVLLRHLEALGLSAPAVVTGGWSSRGYQELSDFAPGLLTDEAKGYGALLDVVFGELALDLPGLYGPIGLTSLFAVPPATLRELVAQLDDAELASAWTDDTTLGWIYQYWNDPDREALDAKINGGGKILPHEIASKTQMFTERYVVEWLLHNSLGLTWLCMCKKQGWTADAERALPVLEARRAGWRTKREAGEVPLNSLMPIEGELEDAWKYYVQQPLPDDAVEKAPRSIKELKLLDPACGSGHFLVIAFDLLARLYAEEARHRGETISAREIAEAIVENNLHGIDIDARAIQIAAAGLYVKAKTLSPEARPKRMNLVAPSLQLGNLPADDPAVEHLRKDLRAEVGIPEELINKLLTSLAGVDYLGSLLKVDDVVDDALRSVELEFERTHGQGDFFAGFPAQQVKLSAGEAKATVLDRVERFLASHSSSEDLGLRLDGEQLAAGVRFVRIAREGRYDIVVGNPPYQALSKTESFDYVTKTYPRGKADLYAAFLERGLELVKPGGSSALLTMRGWMFLGQFTTLRESILRHHDLRALGDFDRGAFDEVPNELLAVTVSVIRRGSGARLASVALLPTPLSDKSYDRDRTQRKRAAVLAHVGRYEFDPRSFDVIDGEPIVYWWSNNVLATYGATPKLAESCTVAQGLITGNNDRFVRRPWEVRPEQWPKHGESSPPPRGRWQPYVMGADGLAWFEPLRQVVDWDANGLSIKLFERAGRLASRPQNEPFYFRPAVAFSSVGNRFLARAHRYRSIFADTGSSVFGHDVSAILAALQSEFAKSVLESLNPTIRFQVGDVLRVPLRDVGGARDIVCTLEGAFSEHEAAREPSVEFVRPGASPWTYAQEWARNASDRPEGTPISAYEPSCEAAEATAFVSLAIGVSLGRFGANGEGILAAAPATALPHGILFLSCEANDGLGNAVCEPIVDAWNEHGAGTAERDDVRTYLRKSFFDHHRKLYENRPIYFPISSKKRTFVAFISIHRWTDTTLSDLLAEHLKPTLTRLVGEQKDIRDALGGIGRDAKTEKRLAELGTLIEELSELVEKVTRVACEGPPPVDASTTARECDAPYAMDLDDGVMVNSAALWPLLEPQWKDPKKWWKELANAKGKKDYDWSQLAARYFPRRVREKCVADASLAVAHKCFWELHPAKSYAWELRLKDEIGADFTIEEPGSKEARARFLEDHDRGAADLRVAEQKRRDRKAKKKDDEENEPLLANADDEENDAELADA